jgi:hypothetical protein
MSTLNRPDVSERPLHGTTTERVAGGDGELVVRNADGVVVKRIPADQAQPSK